MSQHMCCYCPRYARPPARSGQEDINPETKKLVEAGRQRVCFGGEPCWETIAEYANVFDVCDLKSKDIDPNFITARDMEQTSWACARGGVAAVAPSVAVAVGVGLATLAALRGQA